jgi:hypothetical protein
MAWDGKRCEPHWGILQVVIPSGIAGQCRIGVMQQGLNGGLPRGAERRIDRLVSRGAQIGQQFFEAPTAGGRLEIVEAIKTKPGGPRPTA